MIWVYFTGIEFYLCKFPAISGKHCPEKASKQNAICQLPSAHWEAAVSSQVASIYHGTSGSPGRLVSASGH